jgi:hypothetical protein
MTFWGNWNINFTQAELDALTDEVYVQVVQIIDSIKTMKPGIKIVFSGYTYPNFEEVIESAAPFQTIHPFYGTWEGMGFPTFLQINTILNEFSLLVEDYANSDPDVEFFKAPGILQYTYGQTDALGVAPGGTYPPFTQPMPFGDPNYPSPKNSMRDYALTKDCFHLSPKGYRDLIGFHTLNFYQKYLADDQYLLASLNESGGLSSFEMTSTNLRFGKDAAENLSVLLNFETQNMNYDGLEKADIFLRIEEIQGQNPLSSGMTLQVKNGYFGQTLALEPLDVLAVGDESSTPCVFGKKDGPGDWIRIQLPAAFLPWIQQGNSTQFVLQSNASSDGFVRFSDASNPQHAPYLNLKFDAGYTPIRERVEQVDLRLFPNPTEQNFQLVANDAEILNVRLYDYLGVACVNWESAQSIYDIEHLAAGYYLVHVNTTKGLVVKSVLKP